MGGGTRGIYKQHKPGDICQLGDLQTGKKTALAKFRLLSKTNGDPASRVVFTNLLLVGAVRTSNLIYVLSGIQIKVCFP